MGNVPSEVPQREAVMSQTNLAVQAIPEEEDDPPNPPPASHTRSSTVTSHELRVRIQSQNRHFTDPVTLGSGTNQSRTERMLSTAKAEEVLEYLKGEIRTHINGTCPNCSTLHRDAKILLNVYEATPIRCRNTDCNRVFVSVGGNTSTPPLLRRYTLQEPNESERDIFPDQDQNPVIEISREEQSQPQPLAPEGFESNAEQGNGVGGPATLGSAVADEPRPSMDDTGQGVVPPIEAENARMPSIQQQRVSPGKRILNMLRKPKLSRLPFTIRSPIVLRSRMGRGQSSRPTPAEPSSRMEEALREATNDGGVGDTSNTGGQNVEPGISRASTAVDEPHSDQPSIGPIRDPRLYQLRGSGFRRRSRPCKCASCSCTCRCCAGGTEPSGTTSVVAEPQTSESQTSDKDDRNLYQPNDADTGDGGEVLTPSPRQVAVDLAGIRGGSESQSGSHVSYPSRLALA